MTDYYKLRDELATMLKGSPLEYGDEDHRDTADASMAVILAALQAPSDVMIKAAVGDSKNGLQLVAEGFWQAMLNASPLVKP